MLSWRSHALSPILLLRLLGTGMGDSILPGRCGLRFKPPTLVLLYVERSSGKQRRRSMPLRGIGKNINVQVFASDLQNHPRHSLYFQAIPTQQLCSLLLRVKNACHQDIPQDVEEQPFKISSHATATNFMQQPASFTTKGQLHSTESSTTVQGLKPLKDETELGYSSNDSSKCSNRKDGLTAEDTSLSFRGVEVGSMNSEGEESESEQHQQQLNSFSLAVPEIVTEDISETTGLDLNKVSGQILVQKKEKMDCVFEANRVLPGDKGWQYDKEQDFGPPHIEGGWDSDSSSTQDF